MAWVYFTSYLAPGDLPRKDQIDELIDAILERAQATGAGMDFSWAAEQATLQASRLLTDKCYTTHDGQTTLVNVLRATADFYSYAPDSFDLIGGADLISDACASEGITTTDLDDIIAARLPHHSFFNVLRRAVIDGLKYPVILGDVSSSGIAGQQFESNSYDNFTDAVANVEDNETDDTSNGITAGGYSGGAIDYVAIIRGFSNATLNIPATAPFADYQLRVFAQITGRTGDEIADSLTATASGFSATGTTSITGLAVSSVVAVKVGGDHESTTGDGITYSMELLSFSDDATLLGYGPADGEINDIALMPHYIGGTPYSYVGIAVPAFTYP